MTKLAVSEMQNNTQKELSVISRFNLNGPAVVAASAGTGKTYTITGLVVRLLLGDGIPFPLPIDEIMLMTFTNAATRDMKRKVREKIEDICDLFQKCLHNQDVNTVANPNTFEYELLTKNNGYWLREENIKLAIKLLRNAITSMDKANISTIHSFCGGLLKKYAMDSMYDMGSTLVNEDSDIKQEAIYKVVQKYMYKLTSEQIDVLEKISGNSLIFSRENIAKLTGFLATYSDRANKFDENEDLPSTIDELVNAINVDFSKFWNENTKKCIQQMFDEKEKFAEIFYASVQKHSKDAHKFKKMLESATSTEDLAWKIAQNPSFFELGIKASWLKKRDKDAERGPIITELSFLIKQYCGNDSTLSIDVYQYVTHLMLKEAAVVYKNLKNSKRIITNDDLLLNLRDALNSDSAQAEFISDEVRKQYPVAIIDEFQDTDPVQFDIVSKLYLSYFTKLRQNNKSLEETMVEQNQFCGFYIIGDEKQSIYRFRGADVDCYLNAVNTIEGLFSSDCEMNRHVFTLTKNFRSTSKFVEASNELFKPELLSVVANNNLVYKNVDSNGLKLDFINTTENNSKLAPVHIISVDGKIEGEYQDYLAKLCANQIVNDLKNGYFVKNNTEGQLSIDETSIKIKPSNITILVRKAAEYAYVEKALKAVGLTSVYCSDKRSIKQTEEFESILNLMKAVDNPQDRGNIRNLLVSSFFTNDIELFEQNLEDAEYEKLINVLSDCKDTWLNNTFFDMYVHFINNYKILTKNEGEISIQEHLLSQRNGMTKITNLQHAAEIAQKYSSNVAAQTDLIPLFENIINNNTLGDEDETDSDDSMKLRLSGDENTIKVYTYHSSKGLEYDVVYMPFIGIKTAYNEKGYILRSFEENGNKLFDYSKKEESKKYEDVQSEQEELRLWYVAATRPKYRMYLWIYSGQTDKTSSVTDKIAKTIIQGAKDEQHLVNPELFNISLVTYDPYLAFDSYYIPPKNYSSYGASEFDGEINNDWHITSYSAISSKLEHGKFTPLKHGSEDTNDTDEQSMDAAPDSDFCFKFPKGAIGGTFLHEVLEKIDFNIAKDSEELESIIHDLLEESNLPLKIKKSEDIDKKLSKWITSILNTPLNENGVHLKDVKNNKCLKEMPFLMNLGNNSNSTAFIDKLFEISHKIGLRENNQSKGRDIGALTGLLTGVIDLFFECDEHGERKSKFYVADYKSNFLGDKIEYYTPENIKQSMAASNFDIQLLIYSVAAYRFLRNIYGDEEQFFKNHFGGVYYLYLRGMNGENSEYGVYHKPLDEDLENGIIELNKMLGDNNND